MIYILKILLFIFAIFSSLMTYYVFSQHRRFYTSEESNELSIMNKFIINAIACIVYLFFIGIGYFSIYFIFQKILIQ